MSSDSQGSFYGSWGCATLSAGQELLTSLTAEQDRYMLSLSTVERSYFGCLTFVRDFYFIFRMFRT